MLIVYLCSNFFLIYRPRIRLSVVRSPDVDLLCEFISDSGRRFRHITLFKESNGVRTRKKELKGESMTATGLLRIKKNLAGRARHRGKGQGSGEDHGRAGIRALHHYRTLILIRSGLTPNRGSHVQLYGHFPKKGVDKLFAPPPAFVLNTTSPFRKSYPLPETAFRAIGPPEFCRIR